MSREFRVGDRVRRINENSYRVSIGETGVIAKINNDIGCSVDWDRGKSSGSYLSNLELIEPKNLSLFELEEGKVYRMKNARAKFRVHNGRLEFTDDHCKCWDQCMRYIHVYKDFTEITTPAPLKLDGLDYAIEKQEDGSLKVGCQKISTENWEKIKEYMEGES